MKEVSGIVENKLLEYFNGDELAANVWQSKYAQNGETHPDQMHRRMAKEFARIEEKYQLKEKEDYEDVSFILDGLSDYCLQRDSLTEESIYELFKDFKYIVPQGRVMSGLGVLESYRSLSNCLRLPNAKDSYSSIMYVDTMLVSSAKRGCGYGTGLSNLRPDETPVSNAAKTSTGAISFMERYSNSTREVGQNSRRGACLLDLEINHPDSLKFMTIKNDLTKVTGANISLFFNDEFLQAVENDEDYILRFPCDLQIDINDKLQNWNTLPYNKLEIINDGQYVKRIKAKEYWNTFCNSALKFAEPGCFYRSRFDNYSPSNVYSKYKENGTNACGEQPMADFDTCRLIVQNLFSIVKNPFTENAYIDYDLLYRNSYETLRLGDNLVDLECEYISRIIEKIKSDNIPLEEKQIELTLWENVLDMAKSGRRTGCGITALGDMIAAMNLKYDSDEGLALVDKVMKTKMEAELDCTIDLSILRGHFDGWNKELEYSNIFTNEITKGNNDFYQFILETFPEQFERMQKFGRRNVNWNTIAPCGSVSILTQTSSGCEPLFMPYYMRRKKINPNDKNVRVDFVDQNGDKWQEFSVLHPKFEDWMMSWDISTYVGMKNFEDLNQNDLKTLFELSPWYQSTANDINWEKRVEMQSILQKYTTSAISSTLNLPSDTTLETISNIYLKSWKAGLKGQTVYVDGSRSGVLVSTDTKPQNNSFEYKDALKRPKELDGEMFITVANGLKYKVIIGSIDSKPYEVFASLYVEEDGKPRKGKIIKEKKNLYNFYSYGEILYVTADMTDEEAIITRLASMSLRHGANIKFLVEQLNKSNGNITSFGKAVARVLKKYIPENAISKDKCTECGEESMVYEEGCKKCSSCGASHCS
jgi:ribonucleoside-diphosphate reductase alpha chain